MSAENSAGRGAPQIGAVAIRKPDGSIHVRTDRSRPVPAHTNGYDSAHLIEPELTTQQVIGVANHVNALGAVDVTRALTSGTMVDDLYQVTARRLQESGLRFHVSGITNGNGAESARSHTSVVINPLHGAGNAVQGREGSMSVIAGVVNGELARVPGEDEARHMDRIIAPARVRRLGASGISLGADVKYNVRALMRAYRLSSPRDVEAVVLGGSINEEVIDGLKSAGTNLRVVDSADLTPILTALTADRPMMVMGKGEKRDSVIAAVAAKATGGFFEGRYVDANGEPVDSVFGQKQTADTLVSGNKSGTFISFASITGTTTNIGIEGPLGGLREVVRVNRSVSEPRHNVSVGSIDGATGFFRHSILPL